MSKPLTCKQGKCNLPVKNGGYCITHYRRFKGWNSKPMDAPIVNRHSREWNVTPLKDRVKPGDKFNKLTVLEYVGQLKSGRYTSTAVFKVQCACGKEFEAHGSRLISGNTKSCGCQNVDAGLARRLPNDHASITSLLGRYRDKAKLRGFLFSLSRDQFRSLIDSPCYYCGTTKGNEYTHGRDKSRTYGYNGVDRKDSSKGYTPTNTVPCCITCNRAKSDMDYPEFIQWIHRLTTYLEQKGEF